MNIKLHDKENMKSVILESFKTDQELIDTYHVVSGSGLDNCVNKTFNDLNKADPSFKFYLLEDNNKQLGFFGKEYSNYLTTIFIHPDYRNKQSVSKIWNLIKNEFTTPFYTAIYKKNTRALNFYLKNNGRIIREDVYENNPFVLIEFKEV